MTTQEALVVVKDCMENISPYQVEYDINGDEVGVTADIRTELLLGLATLVIHLFER